MEFASHGRRAAAWRPGIPVAAPPSVRAHIGSFTGSSRWQFAWRTTLLAAIVLVALVLLFLGLAH